MLSSFVFVMTLINIYSAAFLDYHGYALAAIPNGIGSGIGIGILLYIRKMSKRRYTDLDIMALAA